MAAMLIRYLRNLPRGKIILWCYLIWWAVTVIFRFDPTPAIWLNALGISAVIGFGLMLAVSGPGAPKGDRWQTFRLFMMPFGVASFSALIKGHGYIVVFPTALDEIAWLVGACVLFLAAVALAKRAGASPA